MILSKLKNKNSAKEEYQTKNVKAYLYKLLIFPGVVLLCFLDSSPCFSSAVILAISQNKCCFWVFIINLHVVELLVERERETAAEKHTLLWRVRRGGGNKNGFIHDWEACAVRAAELLILSNWHKLLRRSLTRVTADSANFLKLGNLLKNKKMIALSLKPDPVTFSACNPPRNVREVLCYLQTKYN